MPWIEKKMKSNSIEETGDGIVRREHLKCPWRAISTDRIGAWGSIVMPPKDAHALSPETWDCVPLQGERDFADMIKLRILRWGLSHLGLIQGEVVLREGQGEIWDREVEGEDTDTQREDDGRMEAETRMQAQECWSTHQKLREALPWQWPQASKTVRQRKLLFQATQFAVVCYSSHKTPTHPHSIP